VNREAVHVCLQQAVFLPG